MNKFFFIIGVSAFILVSVGGCSRTPSVNRTEKSNDIDTGDYFSSSSFEINEQLKVISFDGNYVYVSPLNNNGVLRFDLKERRMQELSGNDAEKQLVGNQRYIVMFAPKEGNVYYASADAPQSMKPLFSEHAANEAFRLGSIKGSYLFMGVDQKNSSVFIFDIDSGSEVLRIPGTSIDSASIGNGFLTFALIKDSRADIQAVEISSGSVVDEIKGVSINRTSLPVIARPYYFNKWFFWVVPEGKAQKLAFRPPAGKIMEADAAEIIDPVGFAGDFFFYITRDSKGVNSQLKVFNTRVGTRFTLTQANAYLTAAIDESPDNPRLILAKPEGGENKTVFTVYEVR